MNFWCWNKPRFFTNEGFLDRKNQGLGYQRNLRAKVVHKLLVVFRGHEDHCTMKSAVCRKVAPNSALMEG